MQVGQFFAPVKNEKTYPLAGIKTLKSINKRALFSRWSLSRRAPYDKILRKKPVNNG